ncbi:MAG: class I SAM-dependent methyltransferase [Cyclobacteriaceae bacterium]
MLLETITRCPICEGESFSNVLQCKDFTQSQEVFQIQKCNQCNFHLTNPRPTQQSIGKYYLSEDYISHTGTSKSIFDFIYLKARQNALSWKEGIISKKKSAGILLDFGSGTGEFLQHMSKVGWNVSGVEPSELARKKANELLGATRVTQSLSLPDRSQDVITLWHVLEHLHDPNQILTLLKTTLKKDGLIFVAVPNVESADAEKYKQYWAAYDVPRHLWHFSKSTMKALLNQNGFKLDEIYPMKLDAYYVSLLSEKYKNHGSHNLLTPIKALLSGYQSNRKAKANNNYSSLVYLASHA